MKKVNFDLMSVDSNAFSLIGAWRKQALREGWSDAEVESVIKEAKSSDYANLVAVLAEHSDYSDDVE